MARNGSGTFSNPYPNFVSGTVISSTQVDANNSDIATALTQSIAVDGQSTVTANLPMNAKKLTGLAVGAAATDSLNLGQAQAEAMVWCGTAGGSANALTLSPTPAITAYAAGQRFVWKASGSVNTGATTVAISGLGTIALQDSGAALVGGDHAAGKIYMGILDTTSTVQIINVQVSSINPLRVTSLVVSGTATAATFEPDGDTAADDNAAIGYTAAEGLILTGQGSTSDITFKNDADATVFTVPTGTDDILFPDSAKAMFGAGSDLQIYHNGSNSYIDDTGTGNLYIRGSDTVRLQSATGEQGVIVTTDGAVTLYHNNGAKLATASGGVAVTGDLTATGTVEPAGDTAADDNAAIGYTAAEGLILTGQGSTSDVTIKNDADATVMSIPTGTTNVGIGTSAAATKLHVDGDVNTILRIDSQNTASVAGTVIGEIQLHGKHHTSSALDTRYAASIIKNVKDSADGTGGSAMTFSTSLTGGGGVSEKLRITKAGNVGIGTTAPAHLLGLSDLGAGISESIGLEYGTDNADGAQFTFRTQSTSTGGMRQTRQASGDFNLGFYNWNGSTQALRMVIDDTGNVGIGTTAPNSKLTSQTATTSTSAFTFAAQLNNSYASNNSITALGFHNRADVNATGVGAAIAMSGGGVASGSGNLIFCIKSTAGIGNVVAPSDEKMRIDSGGTLIIGATSTNATASLIELRTATNTALNFYMLKAGQVEMNMGFKASTDSNFYIGTGGQVVGGNGVYLANTGTSWVSNSDFRKKKNLSPIENALDKIANCRAMTGHFKHEADDVKKRPFLIAQDWVTALPEAVDQDTVDDDGVENLGLSYEGTIPLLVAAIKELREQNIALTNRITALEG